MKQLLRKRTTSTSSPSTSTSHSHSHSQPSVSVPISAPAPISPSPSPATPTSPETPLYARFATTHRGQNKPVVSGPIALAPRRGGQAPAPFNVPAPGPIVRGPSFQKERDERKVAMRGEEGGRGERMARRPPTEDEARERGMEREREREGGREEEREAKRMPSGREALAGRSGGRVEGERVLLPARKVTVKKAESRGEDPGLDGRTKREVAEEERTTPQKRSELEEPLHSPGERVLLPARKMTRRRAEEVAADLREGRPRGPGSREASPVKESDPEMSTGRTVAPRAEGERVLLPARKATRKKAEVERDGEQSSSAGRASKDSRTRETHEAPRLVSFPSSSSTHPGSASTRAVVINPSSDSEGWEDKFSTPKRLHVNSPTAQASSSSMPSKPLRPPLELSQPSETSTKTPKSTANSSTISSTTASTQPSSNSNSTPHALDDRPRVVGDRVLLPARKLTHRRGENSSESDHPSERGRTLSTKRHARLSRDVGSDLSAAASSVPFAASAVSSAVSAASRPGPDKAGYDDPMPQPGRAPDSVVPSVTSPDSSSATQPTRTTSNVDGGAIDAKSGSLSAFAAAHPPPEHANASDGLTSTQASLSEPVSGAKLAASQASTSTAETKGRPPRRRKYSLLAAFGLPTARTASDSEKSTGPSTQNTKVRESFHSLWRVKLCLPSEIIVPYDVGGGCVACNGRAGGGHLAGRG